MNKNIYHLHQIINRKKNINNNVKKNNGNVNIRFEKINELQENLNINVINSKCPVYMYWDKGIEGMPDMIKYIYDNNIKISKKYDFDIFLLTDNNINDYIIPHNKFNNLRPNFKSDIIRYYMLHNYGGIWLDTDIIIIKDLNILYNKFIKSNKEVLLEVEYDNVIGCASLIMLKNSECSNYCLNYIDYCLDTKENLKWGDIGPTTVVNLFKEFGHKIILNGYNIVINGSNFIDWREHPGINKHKWLLKDKDAAYNKSKLIYNNNNCFFVVTWTIYSKNNIINIIDTVFNNKNSVLSYFITN
jgi:hypothetical protein